MGSWMEDNAVTAGIARDCLNSRPQLSILLFGSKATVWSLSSLQISMLK